MVGKTNKIADLSSESSWNELQHDLYGPEIGPLDGGDRYVA